MAVLEYQAVLDAIGDYYGTGSDQWVNFSKYGLAYNDLENTLSQVPGVTIYKNNAGSITGYSYDNPFSGAGAGVAGDINSNIQIPSQGNGTTFTSKIPASGSYNSQSGAAELSSGAKNISSGLTVATVLDKVALGVAGVSLGCKFGKFIDQALYSIDPDWWDSVAPTINPETWDNIASTEAGKSFVNALFGIDKNTGKTQMYLPEDVVSYLAYMMKAQNFFASGQETASIDDTTGLSQAVIDNMPYECSTNPSLQYDARYDKSGNYNAGTSEYVTILSNTDPVYMVYYKYNNTTYTYLLCSKSPFTFKYEYYFKTSHSQSSNTASGTAQTVNNKPVYVATLLAMYYTDVNSISPLPSKTVPSGISEKEIGYVACYGTIAGGSPRDGVTTQPDAFVPNTDTWTNPATTATSLAQQFSDDYQNKALYTDVPQPDGSVTRIKYIPVNTTSTTGANQTSPTNTSETQNSTKTVDNNSTQDLINTILRYLSNTQSENKHDTPTPPNTPNPTDTGNGNTPTIVTPTGQASALFAVYNPSQAQLNSFGAWLWSSNFIDQVLKLFNNPMQAIIGLHKIFAQPALSGSGNIRVGYLDSGVGSNIVGAQYTDIDCGTVKVKEQFGNVFDYSDTKLRLYLPFIGIIDLDTSDVMRGSVNVIYHVDVITGACLAEVKITRDANGGTLYQFAGDAAVRYPISSGSYMGVVSGVLAAVGGVASAVMTGGATLPIAAGAVAGGLSGAHTQVQHSGNFAGNAGAMGAKKPYLIIERPQTMIADGFASYQGNGANTRRTVGQMSGYFKFSDVHTDSISGAAESEIEAIRTTLESGVIK